MTDELTPESEGRYLITTQGSHHVLDLDAGTWRRIPGVGRSAFDYDGEAMSLTHMDKWPRVGDVMRLRFDDPRAPELVEQWRQSSTIKSIDRIDP